MTDKDLKRNIQNALDWEPSIDAAHIGVTVEGGVVTLHGKVSSYSQKMAAERVTQRVYGVKAIANDLVVHLPTDFARTDSDIAEAALGTRLGGNVDYSLRVTELLGRLAPSAPLNIVGWA